MPDPFDNASRHLPTARSTDAGLSHPRAYAIALLALLVVVALLYWPGMGGGYVFDDFPNIVENSVLHVTPQSGWGHWLAAMFSSPASDLQRPLAMLTFAINHALTGLDPYWMKLTNLGIHLLNTTLVFCLARRVLEAANAGNALRDTTQRNWAALWIAAAWGLNPINLMPVLFIVQRMESLSHTFVFGGLWLYLVGRLRLLRGEPGWLALLAGVIGGTAAGLLAKESAVLLPLYALAIEWAVLSFATREASRDRRLFLLFGTILVLPAMAALAWLLPGALSGRAFAGREFTLGERLMTEARVIIDYAHWTLLPDLGTLSLYHDEYPISRGMLSPPSTALAMLLIAAIIGAMLWLRTRRPLMALGLAWFLSAQLLTATIIPLELVYEHRNYFASLGLCLFVADGLLLWPPASRASRVGLSAAMLLLAFYAGVTTLRAREWSSALRFSASEAAKHPQSPRATYDLARNLIILGDYHPDSPFTAEADAALRHAMGVPNATALPEIAAIMLAARTGRPVEQAWWTQLQDKLRTRPIGPSQTASLAALVECQIKGLCELPPQHMVDSLLAALEQGRHPEVLSIYGNYALNVLHDPDLALRLWQDAAARAPSVTQYQVSLAKLFIAAGRPDLAAIHIAKIRKLGRLGQNEALARNLETLESNHRAE